MKNLIFGLCLMIATAIGCIAYERLVKAYSFGVICSIGIAYNLANLLIFCNLKQTGWDLAACSRDQLLTLCGLTLFLTGITSFFWYNITRTQGVMVGSLYEVKYIVIVALIYTVTGETKFTINTFMGVILATASVYFISRK